MKPPLTIFAGPCVLESATLAKEVATELARAKSHFGDRVHLTFKGSFDKANRTSTDSYRGPGLEEGLKILQGVGEEFSLPLVTDFHAPEQATPVAEVVDVLQVPAFLCRQTDLVVAGARACATKGRTLKIKKGQFLAPEQTAYIVEKCTAYLPKEKILLTERGNCFGYNHLVVDMASFAIMKSFGVRAIYDATHSMQLPTGPSTGGRGRETAIVLAKAALAAGADGIFMEIHPSPEKALSDATTQLPLAKLFDYISALLTIYEVN